MRGLYEDGALSCFILEGRCLHWPVYFVFGQTSVVLVTEVRYEEDGAWILRMKEYPTAHTLEGGVDLYTT